MQLWLPIQLHYTTYFLTVATMSHSDHDNKESFTMCKKTMLKDAQTSIAQLVQEIQNHRFPKYPKQQKIIQAKTQIKFAANREIRRTHGAGKKNEATVNAPSKKPKAPTPVSREKPKRKGNTGGGVRKKRQKLVVLPTAASSRPKHNKGRNTSLNEDASVDGLWWGGCVNGSSLAIIRFITVLAFADSNLYPNLSLFGPFVDIIKQPCRKAVFLYVMHEILLCIMQRSIQLYVLELRCLLVVNEFWYCIL
jgi:hypothetical protein